MRWKRTSPKPWSLYNYPKTLINPCWTPSPTLAPPSSQDMPKIPIVLVLPLGRVHTPWILMNICVCFCLHQTHRQSLVQLYDCTPAGKRIGFVYKVWHAAECTLSTQTDTGPTNERALLFHLLGLCPSGWWSWSRWPWSGNAAQSAVAEHATIYRRDACD